MYLYDYFADCHVQFRLSSTNSKLKHMLHLMIRKMCFPIVLVTYRSCFVTIITVHAVVTFDPTISVRYTDVLVFVTKCSDGITFKSHNALNVDIIRIPRGPA